MAVIAKPKAAIRERAEKLDAEGKCVCCGKKVEKPRVRRKGRCDSCHYRYRIDRLQQPKDKRILFDAKLMREGTLLESRQGQRIGS